MGQGSGTGTSNIINGTLFMSGAIDQSFVKTHSNKVSTCSGDNWDNNFIFVFTITNDKPSFQTQLFIRDLTIVHKNASGTVIETLTFDFSSNGSVPANLNGAGAFDPSNSAASVGNHVPVMFATP